MQEGQVASLLGVENSEVFFLQVGLQKVITLQFEA